LHPRDVRVHVLAPELEAEMVAFSREWDRAVDGSPNRLNAAVWGLTRLSKVITHIPIA
jgi:phage terminase large subunit-like protein